jgi:DNA polymerase beta
MTSINDEIIANLSILYENELLNGNKFKANAYKKVITNIKENNKPIKTLEDIKEIKGVGKSILEKLTELLETKKINAVEEIKKDVDEKSSLSNKLLNIYGIGPAKVKELLTKIKSFEELYLEKNKGLLNDKQQIGLKYYDDLQLRIPYAEAKKHDNTFKKELHNISPGIEYEMVGSYRRKNKTVGDIDILIKDNPNFKLKEFIKIMIEKCYFIETLANGKNKFMGICRLNETLPYRRVDILVTDSETYAFALLYFTGSYNFNIYLRNIALEKNLSLSEYGFKDNKTKNFIKTDIKTEEDIFNYLNVKYIAPENRL